MATDGNDTLIGTEGDDILIGLGGDDILRGRDGNDTLLGGDGNDVLEGGKGINDLQGGDGDDALWLFEAPDVYYSNNSGEASGTLRGGAGNDTIYTFNAAGGSNIEIWGDDGDDLIETIDAKLVDAGDGNDRVHFYANAVTGAFPAIDGGRGYDVIYLGSNDFTRFDMHKVVNFEEFNINNSFNPDINNAGAISIFNENVGAAGVLKISLLNFSFDKLKLDASAVTTGQLLIKVGNSSVGNQNVEIIGGQLGDTVDGLGGNDTLDGGGGNDTLNGGAGNDTLTGGAGNDDIDGGDGSTLSSTPGTAPITRSRRTIPTAFS